MIKPFVPKYYGWLEINVGHNNNDRTEHLDDSTMEMHTTNDVKCGTISWKKLLLERFHAEVIASQESSQRYIVIEDMTYKFKRPCVLDLKIGLKQSGPDAPLSKQLAQQEKVSKTTSARLGVRMCGMKFWQIDTAQYVYQDKYVGRVVTEDNLRDSVEAFFNNGCEVRRDVAQVLHDRLAQVLDVMLLQKELKFFSSSLLVVYEGDKEAAAQSGLVAEVRMVDFANTYFNLDLDQVDHGYIRGIQTTLRVLDDISRDTRRESYL
eukprot:ANDGO_01794.mRNA.1 putative inositol polyphosphate kinase C970.08